MTLVKFAMEQRGTNAFMNQKTQMRGTWLTAAVSMVMDKAVMTMLAGSMTAKS
jgi:hypothetical protein